MSANYAAGVGPISGAIYVGRLDKSGTGFAEKQDRTDMVLAVVGEYVQRNFNGGMVATFPALGFAVDVKVTPLDEDDDTRPTPPEESSDV